MTLLSVSEVAQELGCRPRDVSDAFYNRILDNERIIIVAGRRAIPLEYLPEIRQRLTERGKVSAEAGR